MCDSITANFLPAGCDLYAGYDDGRWPDAAAIAARFPGKRVVRITTDPRDVIGDELDIESGDATIADAPAWLIGRRARGADPSLYFSTALLTAVESYLARVRVPWDRAHWHRADYNGVQKLEMGESAHQWRDFGPYDSSVVADYWPGIDPIGDPDVLTPAQVLALEQIQTALLDPTSGVLSRLAVIQEELASLKGALPNAQ